MKLKTVSILKEDNIIILFPSRDYYSEEEAQIIENDIFECFESQFFDEASIIRERLLNKNKDLEVNIKGMP